MYLQYVLICVICVLCIIQFSCIEYGSYEHRETFKNADSSADIPQDATSKGDATTNKNKTMTKKPLSQKTSQTIFGLFKSMQKMSNFDSAVKMMHQLDDIRASLTPVLYTFDPKTTDDNEVITVMWTGGVASTFRICELLFVYKRYVRPLYMEQTNMDSRQSYHQERSTVKALHTFILDTHQKDIENRLLPTALYESPLHNTPNTNEIRKHLSFIFNVSPMQIDNFYIYVIKLRAQQDTSHTELSKKAIELVLPKDGPHTLLRNAVEKWGSHFVRFTKKNPPDANTPQLRMLKCTLIVTEPRGKDGGELSIDQQRHKQFAQFFNHIHFILPCQQPFYRPSVIDKYKLSPIMRRTWSCRQPVHTKHQTIIQRNKVKKNVLLHSSFPIGNCNLCMSCRQRHKDGIERIPPNLFE